MYFENRLTELNQNTDVAADTVTQADFTVAANTIDTQVMPGFSSIPTQMQPVYSDFIKHSYLLNTGTWTNVSSAFGTISSDIMNTFLTGTTGLAIGNKIKNFRYFTTDIKITVTVQGFPLTYGKLLFYADPRPFDITLGGTGIPAAGTMHALPQKCRAFAVPHIEVDPSKTQVYELILKCPTTWGVYSLDQRTGSYALGFQVVNTLSSGQAVAPPTITYSIYMSLVNPEMSVLSFTSASLTAKEQTKVSDHVKSFAKGMSIMGSIPVIGPFTTLASSVSSTVADALSWFGFSKPVVQDKMNMGMFYTCDEQGVLDGKVHAHTLAQRFDNSVTINPGDTSLADFKDQEIEWLANQIGYVRTINFTTAQTSGTNVAVHYLHAQNTYLCDSPAGTNNYEMNNLCLLTRGYQHYKCDFKIRLEFIASIFHRATVVVAYFPDYTDIAISMANAVQTVKNWQFQISGNAIYDLEIPYSQPDPYIATSHTYGNAVPGSPGQSNGVLVFYVLNPNISNGTGDIFCNIYQGGCNLKMGIPSNLNVSQISYVLTSAPAPANTVNPLCIPDPAFYANFFGEEAPHTTKELAGRMVSHVTYTQSVARTGKDFFVRIPGSCPTQALNWNAAATPAFTTFNLLQGAYVGFKGSNNITVYPDTYNIGTKTVLAAAFSYQASGAISLTDGFNTNWFDFSTLPTFATMYADVQNFICLKVPYYYRGYFRPSFPLESISTSHVISGHVKTLTVGPTDTEVQTFIGAGDDFNFVRFRGSPVTVLT